MDAQKTFKLSFFVAVVAWLIHLLAGLLNISTTSMFASVNLGSGITEQTGKLLVGLLPSGWLSVVVNFIYLFVASLIICFLGAWVYEKAQFLRGIPGLGSNKLHHVVWYKLLYGTFLLWAVLGLFSGFKPITWTLGLTMLIYYAIIAWTLKWGSKNFDLEK